MKISKVLAPFSHFPGTSAVLPGTEWKVTGYPTAFLLDSFRHSKRIKIAWDLKNVIKKFTFQIDLARTRIRLSGQALEGHFSFLLKKSERGVEFFVEKAPENGVLVQFPDNEKRLFQREGHLFIPDLRATKPLNFQEQLFLGNHKKQEWERIRKRGELSEFLPLLFSLGQHYVHQPPLGPCSLLRENKNTLEETLLHFFLCGFDALCVPKTFDQELWGIQSVDFSGRELSLLQKAYLFIRSLFFQRQDNTMHLLPLLPKSLHSGSLSVQEKEMRLCLTWTKKRIKTVQIFSKVSTQICFCFPNPVKTFRLKDGKAKLNHILKANEKININKETKYEIDLIKQ